MKLFIKSFFPITASLIFLASVACSNTENRRASNAPADQPATPGAADRGTAADRPGTMPENLSSTDRDFAMKAAQGGMAEIQMGYLAQQRGSSAAVKDLGRKLVVDHSKANQDLKDIAIREGIALPADMDSKQKKTLDRLSKLSGVEFDREFLKEAVRDHKDDISEFEKEIKKGGDPSLKNFASNCKPTIQDHLNMAQSAQGGKTS